MAFLRGVASLKWQYCHSDLVHQPAVLCASIVQIKVQYSRRPARFSRERATEHCHWYTVTVQWWMCSHPFCLGEPWGSEWDCCATTMEPPRKKRKGDLTHRLMMPVSPMKMNEICDGYVPRNKRHTLHCSFLASFLGNMNTVSWGV